MYSLPKTIRGAAFIQLANQIENFTGESVRIQYYADAPELLHEALYVCTYELDIVHPTFGSTNKEKLSKKPYKDSTCIIIHIGTLIHESLVLIKYTNDISEIWEYSYKDRGYALNLLTYIQNIDPTKVLDTYFQNRVCK